MTKLKVGDRVSVESCPDIGRMLIKYKAIVDMVYPHNNAVLVKNINTGNCVWVSARQCRRLRHIGRQLPRFHR